MYRDKNVDTFPICLRWRLISDLSTIPKITAKFSFPFQTIFLIPQDTQCVSLATTPPSCITINSSRRIHSFPEPQMSWLGLFTLECYPLERHHLSPSFTYAVGLTHYLLYVTVASRLSFYTLVYTTHTNVPTTCPWPSWEPMFNEWLWEKWATKQGSYLIRFNFS